MTIKGIRYRGMIRFVTKLKDGNVLRLVILSGLVAVAAVGTLVTSCKSRYGFTNQAKDGAENSENSTSKALPAPPAVPSGASTNTGTNTQTSTGPSVEPAPTTPGGPVAGIEAWQEGKVVTSIVTGKPVVFKPTSWTRDTGAEQGCELNRGIVQASWTVGSRPASDIQRFAGQECQVFDHSGMFTKPGAITVQLDVISTDGEQAHAEASFPVTGDTVSIPDQNQTNSGPTNPGQTPTQQ